MIVSVMMSMDYLLHFHASIYSLVQTLLLTIDFKVDIAAAIFLKHLCILACLFNKVSKVGYITELRLGCSFVRSMTSFFLFFFIYFFAA